MTGQGSSLTKIIRQLINLQLVLHLVHILSTINPATVGADSLTNHFRPVLSRVCIVCYSSAASRTSLKPLALITLWCFGRSDCKRLKIHGNTTMFLG